MPKGVMLKLVMYVEVRHVEVGHVCRSASCLSASRPWATCLSSSPSVMYTSSDYSFFMFAWYAALL